MMKLVIDQDPHNQGVPLFVRDSVVMHPGLTFLVGCNGSGKTALLREIEKGCGQLGEFDLYIYHPIEGVNESVGETAAKSFSMFIEDIYAKVKAADRGSEIVALADLSEYGITADSISQLKNRINVSILSDAESREVELYIFVATPDFECLLDEECLDVQTFNRLHFNNYTSYKKYLMNSRKARDTRYKKLKAKEG